MLVERAGPKEVVQNCFWSLYWLATNTLQTPLYLGMLGCVEISGSSPPSKSQAPGLRSRSQVPGSRPRSQAPSQYPISPL